MNVDARGWRVASVPNALISPPDGRHPPLPNILAVLEAARYGVLQLPPTGQYRPLLAVIADQVAEYAHHGYAVVAVVLHGEVGKGLHWRRLVALLRERGAALPPRHIIQPQQDATREAQRRASFLSGYDLPPEEQRRWRPSTQEKR